MAADAAAGGDIANGSVAAPQGRGLASRFVEPLRRGEA